jgi:hypothetical protein
MRGLYVGRWVNWSMPMDDVPSDPLVAYERFMLQVEERDEVGFARRHKRFFLAEWKHFVELFPGLGS